jgi:hypothetical protein
MRSHSIRTQHGPFGRIYRHAIELKGLGCVHFEHKHHFDHTTFIAQGGARVKVDGKVIGDFYAPCWVDIDKDKLHEFTSLAHQTTLYCVFALLDSEGKVTEEFDGNQHRVGDRNPGVPDNNCGACTACKIPPPKAE